MIFFCCLLYISRQIQGPWDWLSHFVFIHNSIVLSALSFFFSFSSSTVLVSFSHFHLFYHFLTNHPFLAFSDFMNMNSKSHNDVYFRSSGIIISGCVESEDLCELFTKQKCHRYSHILVPLDLCISNQFAFLYKAVRFPSLTIPLPPYSLWKDKQYFFI